MEEKDNDKIVVLKQFESAIAANIAKTKLDAYGIPCFLTDENLAGLYPLPNMTSMQARIHVFENDIERANEILKEEN